MADAKPTYDRATIQRLHSEGFTDLYIGDLFGKSVLEISKARKRSSYWEDLEKSTTEKEPEKAQEKPVEEVAGIPAVVPVNEVGSGNVAEVAEEKTPPKTKKKP